MRDQVIGNPGIRELGNFFMHINSYLGVTTVVITCFIVYVDNLATCLNCVTDVTMIFYVTCRKVC